MHSPATAHQWGPDNSFELGQLRLDPGQKILWRNGQVLPLGPKVVQTLAILAANRGQVMSRDELIRQVWGDTAVEESNLAHNISVLRKTLREDPSGRFTIETVPRRGYRFCESPLPAPVRIAPTEALPPEAPEPKLAIAAVPQQPVARSPRWRWLALASALGVLACVGAVGVHLARMRPMDRPVSRRSVAVVGFANLSQHEDSAWLSPALSEMMTTELGAGGRLLTIPDENVARARTELKLDNRDGFSSDTLDRLRRNLNADLVVSGAYTVLPVGPAKANASQSTDSQVRLDLRVQNAATGETVDALSETGAQSNLFDLIARAGARVRQDLGVEVIAPEDAEQARLSISSNPQALRLYAQGIDKLRNFDALGARDLLQQAAAADPDYALAHSALAEAWMALGYDRRAAQSAETAYRLSSKLGLEQKLLIEGRYREAAHQWKQAVAAYQTLFDAYPDNLEYGLRLTRAQRLGSQYREALATIQALRRLPSPASDDPRIDLEETMAKVSSGDMESAERSAALAAQKGRERGSSLLVAQANLVRPISTLPAFVTAQEDARRICEGLGDLDCVGQAWLHIGRSQAPQPAAKIAIEHALSIFQRVGDERQLGNAQNALGVFFMDRGDFVEARRQYAMARATCEKIANLSCVTRQMLDDGNIDFATADVAAAEKKYREALAMARQTGEEQLIWGSLNNIASLLSDYEGKLAEAEAMDRELVEMDRKSGKEARVNFTLSNLGAVVAQEGRLAEAQRILKEVQDRSVKSGGRPDYGSSAITLAEIDVAKGHPADAEARLQPMAKILEDQKSTFAVTYYDGIAAAQLAQNKLREAQRTIAHARSLMTEANKGFDSYHLAIAEANIVAATRNERATGQALSELHDVIARCHKSGFVGLELQARLAESQIEMQSGATASGLAHLATVERDASSRGFGLIAQQAATARQDTLAEERVQ